MAKKKWIQSATNENEGRVRNYLRQKYGSKAFNRDGTISMSTLNKAIRQVKKNPRRNRNNLLQALYLARNLKRL